MRRPTDAAPDRCGASQPPNRSASMPIIQSPGLHPGLVCVDPLGQIEPSHPQGCTLGWYALTLWVKWNAAGRESPTGRRNFGTAPKTPQTRMNACDARHYEARGPSQNVHPAYTTHSTGMRVRSPQMARLPTQLPTNVGGCVNRPPEARFGGSGGSEGLGFEV
jgi:hypothetical protein